MSICIEIMRIHNTRTGLSQSFQCSPLATGHSPLNYETRRQPWPIGDPGTNRRHDPPDKIIITAFSTWPSSAAPSVSPSVLVVQSTWTSNPSRPVHLVSDNLQHLALRLHPAHHLAVHSLHFSRSIHRPYLCLRKLVSKHYTLLHLLKRNLIRRGMKRIRRGGPGQSRSH